MNKKLPFDTPPGYFEGLDRQMLEHVQKTSIQEPQATPSAWLQLKPMLTMAAAMAVLVVLGKVMLMFWGASPVDTLSDELYLGSCEYSEYQLMSYTEQLADATSLPNEEELLDYLLCDADLEYIAFAY